MESWFRDSPISSVLAVIAVVFPSSLIAYGLTRLRFRGRNQRFARFVVT